jgi:magnesium-transporting ATPase (P-type)
VEVNTSKGGTTKGGAGIVSANHAKRWQRIRSMLTSSKSRPRKRRNDTEDTESREALGATIGEKPPKDGSPRTVPA